MSQYEFTVNWFERTAKANWAQLLPQINPKKILEIGAYEGAATCFLIDNIDQKTEIHCVDTWEGGEEHQKRGVEMNEVERRFDKNVALALEKADKDIHFVKHKERSDLALSKLMAEGHQSSFDFVYVDGSHLAVNVLLDAILGFKLLKVGGYMVLDDYLWSEKLPYGKDPLRCPKIAIDSFTNVFFRKINIISAPLYQIYLNKVSE